MTPSYAIAFLAGLLSAVSPCALPVLPAFLGFLAGTTTGGLADARRRVLRRLLLFSAGFIVTFTLMGTVGGAIGAVLPRTWIEPIVGTLFILWGTFLLLDTVFPTLIAYQRLPPIVTGNVTAIAVGALYGLAWIPCIGPILGAILTMAALQGTVASGARLLIVYGAGMATGLIALGMIIAAGRHIAPAVLRAEHMSRRVAGVMLIVIGGLFLARLSGVLSAKILEWFPRWQPLLA